MTTVVRMGSLRGFGRLVQKLGQDPAPLLARFDLSLASLEDEDALIPVRHMMALLEGAATLCRCPDFGLQLAQGQDATALGPLALALQTASTVAEGVRYAAQYLFTHNPATEFSVVTPEDAPDRAELRFEILLPHLGPLYQVWDVGLGLTHRLLKVAVGDAYRPRLVRVPHAPLAPRAVYARYFATTVLFEQPHAGIQVDRAVLALPVRQTDAALKQVVADYLDQHFPPPGQSAVARTRAVLERTLGRTAAGLDDVAAALATHPRTLQRQLRRESASFEQVRDAVRRDAALRYLTTSRMPLVQVSGLLGLSEQSALTRSCRRWFGRTPLALRRGAGPA